MKEYQLHEGINGKGFKIYCVVTVIIKTGAWNHVARFTNKAEAISHMNSSSPNPYIDSNSDRIW
jgi:hypothetical protein